MSGAFEGMCALVTGASQGIGEAIAGELCRQGARVGMVARTASKLEAAAAAAGPNARSFPCDLAEPGAIERLIQAVTDEFGRLDVLAHSAGAIAYGTTAEADLNDLDRLYATNLRAPFALSQRALPLLRASRGQIVFVNSAITRAARLEGRGMFAATQFALQAVANALRDEVNRDGVRVISVYPGTTATPRQEKLHAAAGRSYAPELLLQSSDIAATVCSALALPRTAEVTDLYVRQMQPPPN